MKLLKGSTLIFILATLTMLVGCGSNRSELNERQLMDIIPYEILGGMNITGITITRRLIEDNTDTVYVEIAMQNADVAKIAYHMLHLRYYDVGGWILTNHSRIQAPVFSPLTPPDVNIAIRAITGGLVSPAQTISLLSSETSNWQSGSVVYIYEVNSEGTLRHTVQQSTVEVIFSEELGQWHGVVRNSDLITTWNLETIEGRWGATWYDDSHNRDGRMTFLIDISNALPSQVTVDGSVTRQGTASIFGFPASGFADESFAGTFALSETYSRVSFTPVSITLQQWMGGSQVYTFEVRIGANGAIYVHYRSGINHGSAIYGTFYRNIRLERTRKQPN
jgi:hypothetical protein